VRFLPGCEEQFQRVEDVLSESKDVYELPDSAEHVANHLLSGENAEMMRVSVLLDLYPNLEVFFIAEPQRRQRDANEWEKGGNGLVEGYPCIE